MTILEQLAELAPALRMELAGIVREEIARADFSGGAEVWRLLSLDDVCERLGRSERQVREWVKTGELACIRLDAGALRFDIDDVQAFARGRRIGGPELPPLPGRCQVSGDRSDGAGSRGRRRASDRRVIGAGA